MEKLTPTEEVFFGLVNPFAVPVLFALFYRPLYGGVDPLVVGQFARTGRCVRRGYGKHASQTVTMIITGLSMGITVLVGEKIGARGLRDAGQAVGARDLPVFCVCPCAGPRLWPGGRGSCQAPYPGGCL